MFDIDASPRTAADSVHRALRDSVVGFPLSDALFRLTGEDARGWLQGQATQDLRDLAPASSAAFCLCRATGQIEAIARAYRLDEGLAVATDAAAAETWSDRCERMVVLEDVENARWAGEGWSVQGPYATRWLAESTSPPVLDAGWVEILGRRALALRRDRTGSGGWDLWFEGPAPEDAFAALPRLDDATCSIAALEAGIPIFGVDVDARVLPPELGPAFEAEHVSYRKGCYLGQEVLMRIHSRGHTNRTWVALLLDGPAAPGDEVRSTMGAKIGAVTRGAESPDYGWIAGAFVRNEVALDGEEVAVATSRGEIAGEVRRFPLLAR